jgi:hypothetical protein
MRSGIAVPREFKKSVKWLVKGTVSPDNKSISVKEMTAQVPTPGELKDDPLASSSPGRACKYASHAAN